MRCVAGREERTVHGLDFLSSTMEDGHSCVSEAGRTLKCSGSLRSEKLVLEGRPRVVSAPRPLGAAWHSCEEAGAMVMSPVWLQDQRGRSEDAEQGVGVRLIWLCLEEVAQPGQPISFSQQTTQTQMSALSRDTARSHCTQDEGTCNGKAGRPGGWDATVLPTASGNVHALGLLCDFL